jgi:hypothetical protein
MNFHLQFSIPPFLQKIKYSHKILFAGSCFAENIGEIMQKHKFNVHINPHGVLYNPASIAVALHRYAFNELMQENELFFANECWNSWEHHSRFSKNNKELCIEEINNSILSAHDFLMQAEWLFITFGSAFVYNKKETNQLVGNCHKIPQQEFTKSLLNVNRIIEEYKTLIAELKNINPKLKIIFTVSPVRYIRDGVVENNLSKARLIEAVHQIVQQNDNAFYFPAYELVVDDLRDYRFYKKDMVHPNEQAIDYVFEKLMNAIFDEETNLLFGKIKELIFAKQHRPLNTATEGHRKFKMTYLERSKQLQKEYSYLDMKEEIDFFSAK